MDINIKELTKEQIDSLREQIARYDGKPKRWKPELSDFYYVIDHTGKASSFRWCEGHADLMSYNMNNVFQTKELAEAEAERRQIGAELEIYALEHNDEIDWSNDNKPKYYILLDHQYSSVDVHYTFSLQWIGVPFFSSKQISLDAIKAIGEDRLRKLFV